MLTVRNSPAFPTAVAPGRCRIIPFPGVAFPEAPDGGISGARQGEAPECPGRGVSFSEHCETFKGVDFGPDNVRGRILYALYSIHIHTIEKLTEPSAIEKLRERRGIGPKIVERIRSALLCRQ